MGLLEGDIIQFKVRMAFPPTTQYLVGRVEWLVVEVVVVVSSSSSSSSSSGVGSGVGSGRG